VDFTDEESRIIGLMMKAEKSLPDDFWHVAAVQELACVLARYQAIMTDEHCATLVGVGAMLCRHGNEEMKAEIQAKMLLASIAPPPRRA
jgi:hypothetical protein